MEMKYTYLVWTLILTGIWGVVFLSRKGVRKKMLRMSLGTAPLGLSEPIFYPEYWHPPTLFNLGEITGFDIESLIFSFSAGGLASCFFGIAPSRELKAVDTCEKHQKRHRFHKLFLSSPAWIFVLLQETTAWNPIYSASYALLLGALLTVYCRPDLWMQATKGAIIFTIFYFLFFSAMTSRHPDYVNLYWNLPALSGVMIGDVPLEELLFAFSLGAMWSVFYEHRYWLRYG